jgi:hypothetical protein
MGAHRSFIYPNCLLGNVLKMQYKLFHNNQLMEIREYKMVQIISNCQKSSAGRFGKVSGWILNFFLNRAARGARSLRSLAHRSFIYPNCLLGNVLKMQYKLFHNNQLMEIREYKMVRIISNCQKSSADRFRKVLGWILNFF